VPQVPAKCREEEKHKKLVKVVAFCAVAFSNVVHTLLIHRQHFDEFLIINFALKIAVSSLTFDVQNFSLLFAVFKTNRLTATPNCQTIGARVRSFKFFDAIESHRRVINLPYFRGSLHIAIVPKIKMPN
jgi:hypothetical protein